MNKFFSNIVNADLFPNADLCFNADLFPNTDLLPNADLCYIVIYVYSMVIYLT